jgi:hypothetical protein
MAACSYPPSYIPWPKRTHQGGRSNHGGVRLRLRRDKLHHLCSRAAPAANVDRLPSLIMATEPMRSTSDAAMACFAGMIHTQCGWCTSGRGEAVHRCHYPYGSNTQLQLHHAAAVAPRSCGCTTQLLLHHAAAVAPRSCCCTTQLQLLHHAAAVAPRSCCCTTQLLLHHAAAVAPRSCCCTTQLQLLHHAAAVAPRSCSCCTLELLLLFHSEISPLERVISERVRVLSRHIFFQRAVAAQARRLPLRRHLHPTGTWGSASECAL